ncbi:hypothetical protein JZO67_000434 [Enterococcus sp. 665A]|uniref:HTH cro/C1-type domain-containing protein n=3 Tax=Enterococcus TaxID=1350 RepID=A0ABV0ELD1_9ENTE
MSQEEIAERIGVTRQAVAKWEKGNALPCIVNCILLAELFDVSLNDFVNYDSKQTGIPIPSKSRHYLGTVTMNDHGQIVLPKKAKETMEYKTGDVLVVLGDCNPLTAGIVLLSSEVFFHLAGQSKVRLSEDKQLSNN